MIDLADVRELHVDLHRLLEQEIAGGNAVTHTWRGWPKVTTICVKLEHPFAKKTLAGLGLSFVYQVVDDPHYWYEEILHLPSGHMLIR